MRSFTELTTVASVNPNWTNKEKAVFHYFNPNGMLARKRATDKLINDAVDAGKAKSGAVIAYGSLNHFNEDRLYQLTSKKYVKLVDLRVTLDMLDNDILAADKFLQTV